MPDPDRTLLILHEELRLDGITARMDHEFSEIHDRLRRIDERIDGFIGRIEKLEA